MQIKVKRIGNSGGRGESEDRKASMVDSGDDVIVLLFGSYGDYRDISFTVLFPNPGPTSLSLSLSLSLTSFFVSFISMGKIHNKTTLKPYPRH